MTQIHETTRIDAGPERVWAVAGDIGRISDWLPALASSTLEGDERMCMTVEGTQLRERILERSDAERYYLYEIIDSPMPLRSYRSVLSVHGHEGHSHVGWTAEFEAADDAQLDELVQAFTHIYREGLESLRAHVEVDA